MMNSQFLMNMARQYQDPFMFLDRVAGSNPKVQAIINNLRGMTSAQRNEYVSNMAKGRNTTMEEVVRRSYPTQILQMLGMQ